MFKVVIFTMVLGYPGEAPEVRIQEVESMRVCQFLAERMIQFEVVKYASCSVSWRNA